jgi:predicted nucleic acid-binding protein
MLLDTDFVIDLHKELNKNISRRAKLFFDSHPDEIPRISLITWMEFAEGFALEEKSRCETFLSTFPVLMPNTEIAWRASRIARLLKQDGLVIGDHDIWIAATALEYDEPLVTRNLRHFERVPGLGILTY